MKNKNINFKEYLRDKRIVLVGPSSTLLDNKDGNLIDSYDIVIRIKKAFPIDPKLYLYIGKRTDVLATHLKVKQNNFVKKSDLSKILNNIKWIYMPFAINIDPFNKFYKNFRSVYNKFYKNYNGKKITNVHITPYSNEYMLHSNNMKTTPTTGAATMLDLLNYDFKELYITGFTFRKNGYYKQYKSKLEDKTSWDRTIGKGVHDMDLEINYIKQVLSTHENVTVDKKLQDIFNEIDLHNIPISINEENTKVNEVEVNEEK